MDNGSQEGLTLMRLPQGGFIVCDMYHPGNWTQQHLACTSIDDALKFMRDKIKPIDAAVQAGTIVIKG